MTIPPANTLHNLMVKTTLDFLPHQQKIIKLWELWRALEYCGALQSSQSLIFFADASHIVRSLNDIFQLCNFVVQFNNIPIQDMDGPWPGYPPWLKSQFPSNVNR